MLSQVGQKQAECLLKASEVEQSAACSTDLAIKAEHERAAHRWRKLARSYKLKSALGRFISFNKNRQKAASSGLQQATQPPSSTVPETEDLLDRLARVAASIKHYSWTAALIGQSLACEIEPLKAVLAKHSGMRSRFRAHEQVLFAQAQQSAACNITHDIENRLARWVLRAADCTE
jgi:hypothetical protein